jgi:HAD superfamily hydrolase (TIGR01509 family)
MVSGLFDMIEALIFDFDGLILDTELPDLQSWEQVYAEYGVPFPISSWIAALGGSPELFNPYSYLQSQLDEHVNVEEIQAKKRHREYKLLYEQCPLPGVVETIDDARRLGLTLAVASSSMQDWVLPHLSRLGLLKQFDTVKCADDVHRTKPAPDLFHAVLQELNLQAESAIVFEDSPNGILAAKRAGIFCVVVPNSVTSKLCLDNADLRLGSLADMPLKDLLQYVRRSSDKEDNYLAAS